MWKEFRPTILFLVKFFVIYIALSTLYGLFISKYDTAEPARVDPFTHFISYNCSGSAMLMGYSPNLIEDDHLNREDSGEEVTYDSIWMNGIYAISVEEGCNGLNIMLLFIAFVVAFGGSITNMLIFIPLGILFIHISNIGRLMLLSLINVEYGGRAFHFYHKYLFTAIIYGAVLLLWYLWAVKFSGRNVFSKKREG